ncbi:MAG: SLATT domain-containing protein [Pseudomonadota bacterium]
MSEAEAAFAVAAEYAAEQIDWYDRYAFIKHMLFRASAVGMVVASVLTTYLAATLEKPDDLFLRFKRKNAIAVLAATSAILVGLTGLFDWRSAWESHRLAQFEIQAAMKVATIRKLQLTAESKDQEVFELARELAEDVRNIVSNETVRFFATQPQADDAI